MSGSSPLGAAVRAFYLSTGSAAARLRAACRSTRGDIPTPRPGRGIGSDAIVGGKKDMEKIAGEGIRGGFSPIEMNA
jgi:hypothetical protein